MTNKDATWLVPAGRSAWPRYLRMVLSCAVAAFVVEGTTATYAQMGENAITSRLEITPPTDPIQRYCTLGTACGDDGALAGPFGGVWRDGQVVEPGARTFSSGIRFIGKVLSAEETDPEADTLTAFDVYCSTEGLLEDSTTVSKEGCARVERTELDVVNNPPAACGGIINVRNDQEDQCDKPFDYMIEYDKAVGSTILRTCKADVVADCQEDTSALVTDGQIVAYRALFDYDCVRYCYGGCCRF